MDVVNCAGDGPIPARAGEPLNNGVVHGVVGAYPRSRGGTWYFFAAPGELDGLSPLARGNLYIIDNETGETGPIPARAGEPQKPCRLA